MFVPYIVCWHKTKQRVGAETNWLHGNGNIVFDWIKLYAAWTANSLTVRTFLFYFCIKRDQYASEEFGRIKVK